MNYSNWEVQRVTEAKTTATKRTTAAKKAEEAVEEPTETDAVPADLTIFERINLISKEAGALAPESKGGVPFAFRGIDGTVAHLSYFLNKYGVFAAPKVASHEVTEREVPGAGGKPSGRAVKTTRLEVEYTFYGPAGDSITVTTPGLADDFADRSSAQAMSVAYRIALLQLFHLPTHSREPEEAGEETMRARAAAASGPAPVAGPAVAQRAAAAKAGPPAQANLAQLQGQAKALGSNLGKGPDDLNALGAEVSGGAEPGVWFNDAAVMSKLVDILKAESAAG